MRIGDREIRRPREAPYTSTAKRYTFTYTRARMEPDHGELDVFAKTTPCTGTGTRTGTMGARAKNAWNAFAFL